MLPRRVQKDAVPEGLLKPGHPKAVLDMVPGGFDHEETLKPSHGSGEIAVTLHEHWEQRASLFEALDLAQARDGKSDPPGPVWQRTQGLLRRLDVVSREIMAGHQSGHPQKPARIVRAETQRQLDTRQRLVWPV